MNTKKLEPFLLGGISSCNAELATFPNDLVKTRLQIQGQNGNFRNKYRGMFHCFKIIVKEEGYRALYNGIKPALLRQATYGTLKLGFYQYLKKFSNSLAKKSSKDHSIMINIACGMISGASANAIANPTDVLKVRCQSQQGNAKKGVFQLMSEIYKNEGLTGLYRGVLPNAQRAAIVTGIELSMYDSAKQVFINQLSMGDNMFTHFAASNTAGFFAAVAATPIDVIKTRIMNQQKLIDGSNSENLYKGSFDCLAKTIKNEGASALYKGFLPSYLRIAPFNIIFFLTYEKLKF